MDITLHVKNLLSRRKKTVGDGRISLYPAMDGEMETTAITDERTRVFFVHRASPRNRLKTTNTSPRHEIFARISIPADHKSITDERA